MNQFETTAGSLSLNSRVTASTLKGWSDSGTSRMSMFQAYYPYNNFTLTTTRNSFEQAFKVVSMLIEQGYLKNVTLRRFIAIVKEVEDEL